MSPPATLQQARAVLSSAAPNRNRMACWLTRSALEDAVERLLIARGRQPGDARMSSLLSCLRVAYEDEPGVHERADFAWSRLSNACHQHAYELSPTAAETAALIEAVGELVAQSRK